MNVRTSLAACLAATVSFASAAHAGPIPNGWIVTPAGSMTPLGTLPLHMAVSPGGRWIAVTNAGYGDLSVTIVDAASGQVADSKPLKGAYYGIAFSPDGKTVYASTAAQSGVEHFAFDPTTGQLHDGGAWRVATGNVWTAGLAVAPDGSTVYVTGDLKNRLYAVDARNGTTLWTAATGIQPVAVALSHDGKRAFVSDWAGSAVTAIDTKTGSTLATIRTAHHPNAIVVSPDGQTVYVACANANAVEAIDARRLSVRSTIDAGLWPNALEGTTPNGLVVARDSRTLFVADAGDDAVAAIDVSGAPKLIGAVPFGWYVTDVALSPDGATIYALDGNGASGHANPLFRHTAVNRNHDDRYYVGTLVTGDLERAKLPGRAGLAAGLTTARHDARYGRTVGTAVYTTGVVKHVIYIIKENRTYDEILGDDPRGNGDTALAIFGKRITPNIHRLADDFVLLDNFEENSFVSADGHNWTDSAFATDYVEKLWPANYADRDRPYDFEADEPSRPDAGYLWDDALAHGRSVRDYGEYVVQDKSPTTGELPSMKGHVDPWYHGWDLKYSDQARIDEWEREFSQFERSGNLPDLEIVYLPDDHTAGTSPEYRTPYAMLASNDYAVGRLVERLSHSRYWKDTVVFSVEDDAQSGPDHVSDMRAEAIIAGGPVRRHVVDHTHYTQCSVLATIEGLLELAPMSQYDAGAKPMDALITDQPDARPWTASRPNVDINEHNTAAAPGARTSMRFDLRAPDAADATTMNRVLFDYAASATRHRNSRGAAHRGV